MLRRAPQLVMALAVLLALAAAVGFVLVTVRDGGRATTSSSEQDIVGTWQSQEEYATEPYLTIRDDGTWTGSDGCNETGGRWRLDDRELTVSAEPVTLVGCEGEPLPGYFAEARSVSFERFELQLLNADDEVLVELYPAQ